jgi:ABC-type transporter Mla MlaB component
LPTPDDEQDQVVDLDVSWLVPADLCAVDALAQLQVAAARRGCRLQLHGADGGLVELIDFIGFGGLVHLCPCCSSSTLSSEGRVRGS